MYYHVATLNAPALPTYGAWLVSGRRTSDYIGSAPTYQLILDWTTFPESAPREIVDAALQKAFEDRTACNWGLFIKGDHLMKLVREFRGEYVMLIKGNYSVDKLDGWVHALLDQIQ